MDIRPLSDNYAVSPQIEAGDIPAIKAAGYTTVVCNRPDAEVPADQQADAIRRAAEAAGLRFVDNPVTHGALTDEIVATQVAAQRDSDGPVLAYCASGNRCSIVWALGEAGRQPADALIAAAARHGYRLEGLRPTLEARAAEAGG